MPPGPADRPESIEPPLALLAVLGQGIVYLSSLLLARQLHGDGFDDYVVASAVFMLMATVAPLGTDKYALRALPVYLERKDWARAHGYLRFALRRVIVVSLLLAMAMLAWALWPGASLADSARGSVAVAALAVPLGALASFALEALTASGRKVAALAIVRITVPATALACIVLLLALRVELSAMWAVACWGPGWLLGLALMLWVGRRSLLATLRHTAPLDDATQWRAEARPFFVYRLAMGLLSQSALIAMAWLEAPATAIGAYAAAAATAGLATVLATSTNRAYGRRLSILLERGDSLGVPQLRRERLRWLLPTVAVFLGASFLFGHELLALFRPDFADQGVTALRILAVGASVAVLLALAPTYLKYNRRKRAIYATVACAALAQWLLLLLLVPTLGATGAATAYTVSICGMYGAFAWMARRELLRFRFAGTTGSRS